MCIGSTELVSRGGTPVSIFIVADGMFGATLLDHHSTFARSQVVRSATKDFGQSTQTQSGESLRSVAGPTGMFFGRVPHAGTCISEFEITVGGV
jgi:hypothetical protein